MAQMKRAAVVVLDKQFKDEAHKKAYLTMSAVAFDKAYSDSRQIDETKFKKEMNKSFNTNTKVNNSGYTGGHTGGLRGTERDYGGMLNQRGLSEVDNKEHRRLARKDEERNGVKMQQEYINTPQLDGTQKRVLTDINIPDFSDRSRSSSFFIGRASYGDPDMASNSNNDDGGVVFSHNELDRYSKPEPRTQFDSKVEESIYRAKKYLLKKNGHWD